MSGRFRHGASPDHCRLRDDLLADYSAERPRFFAAAFLMAAAINAGLVRRHFARGTALRLMVYGTICLAMLLSDMRLDAYQLHPESWFLFIAVRIMAYSATLFLRAVDHGQTERLRFEQAPLQESVALDRARIAHARTATEMAAQIKSQFLATMSHEISTPMNGVIGLAKLLAETPLDTMQRQYVSTIVVSSRALLTSIDDVLDLAKLQAGKFDLTV